MRWGLIPHFAKSLADFKGLANINVKAETIQERAMWRVPFQKRRCLVPADGFYEWQRIDAKTKRPYFYSLNDGKPFAFSGLWDAWKDTNTNEWLLSFAIITTTPNELTAQVHNRMPVIVQTRDYDRWLRRGDVEQQPVDVLKPYPAEEMSAQEANKAVGNVRNNGPEMRVA